MDAASNYQTLIKHQIEAVLTVAANTGLNYDG